MNTNALEGVGKPDISTLEDGYTYILCMVWHAMTIGLGLGASQKVVGNLLGWQKHNR